MKYGMNVPIFGEYADVRLLADLAGEAEAAGWDGFWIWDHLQWSGEEDGEPRRPAVDPTVALALIAAGTTRVRFGPMITPLARRRPWKLARELTTLDHLSGGRLTLGVGLGGPPGLEFGDFGEETDARVRAGKLDEALEVLLGLWTGQPFSYAGRHHRVTRAEMLPQPLQDRDPRSGSAANGPSTAHRFAGPLASTACTRCCSPSPRTGNPLRSLTWSPTFRVSAPMIGRSTWCSEPRRSATDAPPTGRSWPPSQRPG